jgi:hypothetical protein
MAKFMKESNDILVAEQTGLILGGCWQIAKHAVDRSLIGIVLD